MKHIVLLGDSIFDNGAYVNGGPDVVTQLRAILPDGWRASLSAVDGAITSDVVRQHIPHDATHLVVSVGGNDALQHLNLLTESAESYAEVLSRLAAIKHEFQEEYREMLRAVKPTAVCTIYDGNFDTEAYREIANAGLSIFNDVITREACEKEIPVIDLRVIFNDAADYANAVEP